MDGPLSKIKFFETTGDCKMIRGVGRSSCQRATD